jgi:membrane-associated protease RseP (regulator of RpoE activity)
MTRVYPQLPFWWSFGLSPGAVLYVVALTVLAAAVIGVLPALKATGRRVQAGLQGLSPGGGSGMRFGRTWTALVVAEVAFSVALLPAVAFNAWDAMKYGTADPGFAAGEFLSAQLVLDRPITPRAPTPAEEREFNLRYAARQAEVTRRLQAESAVSVVTFASSVPGEEATVWIEADGVPMPSQAEAEASGFAVRSGPSATRCGSIAWTSASSTRSTSRS